MQKINKQAFTLVELIVVITILAILGTIAFISLQGYSRDARDSVRTTDLKNISKQLELMLVKAGQVYVPENKVDITASGTVILYQGEMGLDTLNKLKVNNGGLDPSDQTPYTYATTKNLKQYEIMGFLEGGGVASVVSQANAGINFKNRFPYVKGNNIGILLDTITNQPINLTGTGIDLISNMSGTYDILISNSSLLTLSGSQIITMYSILNKNLSSIDSSLVGYWDMETLSGSMLKDLSKYKNDGTCYNSGTLMNCGKIGSKGPKIIDGNGAKGKTILLDGIDDYIDFGNPVELSNISNVGLGIWFNPGESIGTNDYLFSHGWWSSTTDTILVVYNINKLYISNKHLQKCEINVDLINKWSYIFANYKTNSLEIYINGIKRKTCSTSGGWLHNTIQNMYVGTQNASITSNNPTSGNFDEVRIYNRALSDTEIKALYDSSN